MKYSLKIFLIILVLTSWSIANPCSKTDDDNGRLFTIIMDNQPISYRPSLRQGGVLFVEDPGHPLFGPVTKPDPVWEDVLTDIYWDTTRFGWYGPILAFDEDGPALDTMLQYELVIWNTYDYWWETVPALTENDQNNIGMYLENGGMVWLIGQDLLDSEVPMSWMSNYFHLDSADQDYDSLADSIHVHGLAEIDSISFTTIYDYQLNHFWSDELMPDAQAHGVLEDTDSNKVIGILYPGTDWVSVFWTVDGRPDTTHWDDWRDMVYGMLGAFGYPGIVERSSQLPARKLQLHITPDPCVRSTTIKYTIPVAGNVNLQVFNKTGQHIITLNDVYKHAGSYTSIWNCKDTKGVNVPNGVYFVRLTCGKFCATANVVIIR
ncbi:T9SS type A sorting domain-containing protein [candidate division WOR-3 bacterium]|nr:T9SS type A sorting domain-containing protein [candidate division WOR-3 bacterium]